MLIIRHTLIGAALGALTAYGLFGLMFAGVSHFTGDVPLSFWPTHFMFVLIGVGVLVGGAAGVETGVIATTERDRAMRRAMLRHPASDSRADHFHATNQWGV